MPSGVAAVWLLVGTQQPLCNSLSALSFMCYSQQDTTAKVFARTSNTWACFSQLGLHSLRQFLTAVHTKWHHPPQLLLDSSPQSSIDHPPPSQTSRLNNHPHAQARAYICMACVIVPVHA